MKETSKDERGKSRFCRWISDTTRKSCRHILGEQAIKKRNGGEIGAMIQRRVELTEKIDDSFEQNGADHRPRGWLSVFYRYFSERSLPNRTACKQQGARHIAQIKVFLKSWQNNTESNTRSKTGTNIQGRTVAVTEKFNEPGHADINCGLTSITPSADKIYEIGG